MSKWNTKRYKHVIYNNRMEKTFIKVKKYSSKIFHNGFVSTLSLARVAITISRPQSVSGLKSFVNDTFVKAK